MTITEAMRAVSDEYDEEAGMARASESFGKMMEKALEKEYDEIDAELPKYVAEIARTMGVKAGTYLPPYVYQAARTAFRMGMRTQRKIDHPSKPSSAFWRTDGPIA